MASVYKVGDRYRAQVRKRGVDVSEMFSTRAEANRWAAQVERDIEAKRLGKATRHTWRDAVDRYRKDVSAKKPSADNEAHRLNVLLRVDFVDRPLADITSDDWSAWRSSLALMASSVNRDMTVVRHIYRHVCEDWGWLPFNPMTKLKRLKESPHRKLVWPATAQQTMLDALGGASAASVRGRVALAFQFALETGMRSGEICALRREDIHGPVARLHKTKNGDGRDVPLSPAAVQILDTMGDRLFDMTPASLDAMFRKYRPAHLSHLHFHDARHTAATRLGSSGVWTLMELCAAFGWKDPRHASIYFNPSAHDLAAKLASGGAGTPPPPPRPIA